MNESARMDQNIKEKNCCHYLLEKLEVGVLNAFMKSDISGERKEKGIYD